MKRSMTMQSSYIGHQVLKTILSLTQGLYHRRLIKCSKNPRHAQVNILKKILATNARTEFGKHHGFKRINDVNDFRKAVAIHRYEDLRSYIERQELTGESCLTSASPVYYHRTSGTVGEPKNIPVTKSGLTRIKQHQQLSAYTASKGSEIFRGKVFGITGQAIEGRMAGGTPFGSASGLIYQNQSKLVRARYVLPPEVSEIENYETRYIVMAIYGLAEPFVTCIGTANPSTLIRLLSVINQNIDLILDSIAAGRLPDTFPRIAKSDSDLSPNAQRAEYLRTRCIDIEKLTFSDIWPELKGIVTWTGGSCAVPLRRLTGLLPDNHMIIELGYVASEVRGTVNVDVRNNLCLPTLMDTYFEFVERESWEQDTGDFLSLHELEDGREYYVFVTTSEGLYRYDMNDIVRVTGMLNETPIFAFVQKGKGVTNITGEKLHEAQVLNAVMATLEERDIQSNFFIMLADQEDAGYTLYVETASTTDRIETELSNALERYLRAANIEYDGKRASGRLASLVVRWLPNGTGDKYRSYCVSNGQRDAQFKYLHLQYAHECSFDFNALALSR